MNLSFSFYSAMHKIKSRNSPRVPSVEELSLTIEKILNKLPKEQIWINPDCGLKTRAYEEVIASLKNLVIATQKIREKL